MRSKKKSLLILMLILSLCISSFASLLIFAAETEIRTVTGIAYFAEESTANPAYDVFNIRFDIDNMGINGQDLTTDESISKNILIDDVALSDLSYECYIYKSAYSIEWQEAVGHKNSLEIWLLNNQISA
ncbi:MAG: hypothetical protein WCR27_07490, partial [Eubacteriales bacterium]